MGNKIINDKCLMLKCHQISFLKLFVLAALIVIEDPAPASPSYTSVFFDMEKAYDMTWRHGILKDLSEAGVRGKMFDFIKNFLKPRMFKVLSR